MLYYRYYSQVLPPLITFRSAAKWRQCSAQLVGHPQRQSRPRLLRSRVIVVHLELVVHALLSCSFACLVVSGLSDSRPMAMTIGGPSVVSVTATTTSNTQRLPQIPLDVEISSVFQGTARFFLMGIWTLSNPISNLFQNNLVTFPLLPRLKCHSSIPTSRLLIYHISESLTHQSHVIKANALPSESAWMNLPRLYPSTGWCANPLEILERL